MPRLLLHVSIVLLALGATGVPGAAAAPAADARSGDAIALARSSAHVRDLLRLNDEDSLEVRVDAPDPATPDRRRVGWQDTDGDNVVEVVVDLRAERVLLAEGPALIVMPHRGSDLFDYLGSPWRMLPLLGVFAVLVAAGPGSRRLRAVVGGPMLVTAACCVWTLSGVVGSPHLRAWSILQYGLPILATCAGAWLLLRRGALRDASAPRLPVAVLAVLTLAGLGVQAWESSVIDHPIDVAYASAAGADLIGGGVRVYGNMLSIPGVLLTGDTYGPVSYLAYVPGRRITSDVQWSILSTNVVLSVLVAALLVALGIRRGSARTGWWAAAVWATCPSVVLAVAGGHNDVVIAAALAAVPLVLARPAWRGALVAVAAATKVLPMLALAGLVGRRGDSRPRSWRRVAAAFVAVSVALWTIGLRDPKGLRIFLDRVRYQLDRGDVRGAWDLAGVGPLHNLVLVLALVLVVIAVRRRSVASDAEALAGAAAPVLAASVGMSLFWFSYVTWAYPLVLAACVAAVADTTKGATGAPFASGEPDVADEDVSSGRRAGAPPSSSVPS